MVIGSFITQFNDRNSNGTRPPQDPAPSFNSIISPLNGLTRTKQIGINIKKRYMKEYLDNVPQLTAIINMVAGDICEQTFFEPLDLTKSGRNKVLKAKKFEEDVSMRKQDFSTSVDMLSTGEGYGWMGELLRNKALPFIKKSLSEKGLPVNDKTISLSMESNFPDEDFSRPTRYRQVASTTMENLYTDTRITGYIQRVSMKEKYYTPEEIIRYIFYDIDGRVEGFTPVRAMLTQLQLDWFMWQNMKSLAKNGGQADRIYSVEDIDINSPAFKRIEKELQKYHKVKNRHGSLLLNGKISLQDLQQLDTMQFKEMGLFIATVLASQWQVPKSRMPMLMGGTNTKDDTGGNSERAYYRNIEFLQDLYINTQNKQLWIPHFGVRRRFKKAYKHDELIEEQTKQTKLNNLTFLSNELAKTGKQLTSDYILRYVNGMDQTVHDSDIEDKPIEVVMPLDNSQFRQNQPSNDNLTNTQDKKNVNQRKRNEKLRSEATLGTPTGMGKSVDIELETKEDQFNLKEYLEFKERQKVSFGTFMQIYNEEKKTRSNNRVFVSEKDGIMRFTFKGEDFVYETMTPTSQVSNIQLMNFKRLHNVDEDEILDALDFVEVSDND